MASAGAIRAAQAYVELSLRDRMFKSGLKSSLQALKGFGVASGAALAAFGVRSIRVGAEIQQAMADLRAVANPTADQWERIKTAISGTSAELGRAPKDVISAYTELLRAGMSVEDVINGAGKAALQFAKVGGIEFGQAAVVMSDAMNVFKVSASVASNTISSAADASSTSVDQMAQAFSMSSAVAGLANQNITDLAAALSVLANNGVKGSDAGTAVKTMLLRLMAPTSEAAEMIAQVGLSTRDASGKMLPMGQLLDNLRGSLARFNKESQDQALNKIFGTDAIRAAAILGQSGSAGLDAIKMKMSEALSISEKYKIQTDTLVGSWDAAWAAADRLGVTITDQMTPGLTGSLSIITDMIQATNSWATANDSLVATFSRLLDVTAKTFSADSMKRVLALAAFKNLGRMATNGTTGDAVSDRTKILDDLVSGTGKAAVGNALAAAMGDLAGSGSGKGVAGKFDWAKFHARMKAASGMASGTDSLGVASQSLAAAKRIGVTSTYSGRYNPFAGGMGGLTQPINRVAKAAEETVKVEKQILREVRSFNHDIVVTQ